MACPESDERHWRFVRQAVDDLNQQLASYGHQLYLLHGEVLSTFVELARRYRINRLISHQETGLQVTYQRDIAVAEWACQEQITWEEHRPYGVHRGLSNRKTWVKAWYSFMSEPIAPIDLATLQTVSLPPDLLQSLQGPPLPGEITTDLSRFQPGGERYGQRYLQSFLGERYLHYGRYISKPQASRKSCSRLSTYLAWGCLSVRQCYQAYRKQRKVASGGKRALDAFASRLRWHCHFIQKFESEDRIEFENFNRGFDSLEKSQDERIFQAWCQGQTGYPLVDACMRCVIATGYLNFRMRAMLVSFLTHHLWQHWKAGAIHLARQFLDFEPGIHYPQFQMQAGMTGINTVRIYNPVKQSQDHDADGVFIKAWVPELQAVPPTLLHEPWKLSPIEQAEYHCVLGKHYPAPVVALDESRKRASDQLWGHRKNDLVRSESRRILARHTIPGRRNA